MKFKFQITLSRPHSFGDHAETKETALDSEYYSQFQFDCAIKEMIKDNFQNLDKNNSELFYLNLAEIKIKIISFEETE